MAEPKTPLIPEAPPPAWVKELLLALKPQGPLEQAGLTPEQIAQIKELPKVQRYRKIPWRSEETGATGVAVVVESKRFPANGRIVAIEGYTHPREAYVYQGQEGLLPDNFPMWKDAPRALPEGQEPLPGDLTPAYLQWRYETFYRADLRFFIGREMKASYCAEEGPALGIKTPWLDSRVGAGAVADAA